MKKEIFLNKKVQIIFVGILLLILSLSVFYFVYKSHNKQGRILGVFSGTGDFSNQIIGTTPTQAILTYSSPTTNPCTVQVSQSSSYSPLVNDVNPSLFSGSNSDNRTGNISGSTQRVFVIGKRSADTALDGNRYSRALETYTTHYYKITCGSAVGTGSFTTQTIPSGVTYSDTIPGSITGSPSWPTILTDRNQEIIDPQTGLKIKRASLNSDYTTSSSAYPSYLTFGAAGSTDVCSETMVIDNTGNYGYHCIVNGVMFWVNPTSGESRPVGIPANLYDGVTFGSFSFCSTMDTKNPNVFYCIPTTMSGKMVIVRLEYMGNNTFSNETIPICTGSNTPCMERTILTPASGGNDLISLMTGFDPEFSTNFNVYGYTPEIKAIQNSKIILQTLKSIQDSYGWYFVFDIGNSVPVGTPGSSAGIIAGMSTYKHYPIRWCSSHNIDTIGNVNWISASSNYLAGNSNQPGYGIYTSNIVAGNLPATTTTCPTNSFGDSVCTNIIVDGEPCDEDESPQNSNAKCGVSSSSYLQDAEVGDIFGIEPNPSRGRSYKEFVRLIAKSGNTWTVARGINQTPIVSHPTGVIDAACTAHDTAQTNYDLGSWLWDFVNDPHGTGTPGTTIIYDKNATGGHRAYRPNSMIEITYPTAYQLRSGAVPAYVNATKIIIDDANPTFSGVQGIGYPNTVDSHPSPFYNDSFFLDGRPMNSGITYSASATNLGSGIYKYPAGAVSINRKKMATIAYSGTNILSDISGPSSNISTAANYSYCVVINAGECYSGSLATEVYVKSSSATTSLCPFPGVALNGWNQQHICIGDNSIYNQAIAQIGPTVRANGKNGRMLTHALTTYNRQDVYWNVRGLPNGSGMLFVLPNDPFYGNGAGQLFYAKIPPFTVDATLRNDFLSIPVTIPANASATSASVIFGYAENGSPENFYCTSRKEACVKASESASDYSFASASYTPVSCASGCTINIPAIPERIVYLKVQYHSANGSIIQTLSTQAVAAEPPYNISEAISQDTTPPTVSISAPTTGSTVSGTSVTITATAADNISLTGVQFKLNNSTNIGSEDTASPYSITWNSTTVVNGNYGILAVARDAAGNMATSTSISVTVNNSTSSGSSSSGGGGGGGGSSGGGGGGTSSSGGSGSSGSSSSSNNSNKASSSNENSSAPNPDLNTPAFDSNRSRCLIKDQNNFRLTLDGQFFGLTSPQILDSYGFEFKDAIVATTKDKAAPIIGNVLPADGSLVKSKESGLTYIIENGQRRPFPSLLIFIKSGYKISSIYTISLSELNNIPLGSVINSADVSHPRGVNIKDGNTIYWMGSQTRYAYPSLAVYNSWNVDNNFTKVVPANAQDRQVPIANILEAPPSCK